MEAVQSNTPSWVVLALAPAELAWAGVHAKRGIWRPTFAGPSRIPTTTINGSKQCNLIFVTPFLRQLGGNISHNIPCCRSSSGCSGCWLERIQAARKAGFTCNRVDGLAKRRLIGLLANFPRADAQNCESLQNSTAPVACWNHILMA